MTDWVLRMKGKEEEKVTQICLYTSQYVVVREKHLKKTKVPLNFSLPQGKRKKDEKLYVQLEKISNRQAQNSEEMSGLEMYTCEPPFVGNKGGQVGMMLPEREFRVRRVH